MHYISKLMTKGGTLREESYNELQTFAKNAVKLRG
jgi:hypothetical protein